GGGKRLGVGGNADRLPGGGRGLPPAEAPHAPRAVRRKARARLLAGVADVDARLELPVDGPPHGRVGFPVERRLIDRLSAVLPDEKVSKRRRARQGVRRGGADPPVAAPRAARLAPPAPVPLLR